MTTLAGLATSLRNSDDMKTAADIRFTLLKLPPTKLFADALSDPESNQELHNFKNDYLNATGVEQQLALVQKMVTHFTSDDDWILNQNILCQLLTDIYFHALLKHPIRSFLAKAIQKEAAKKGDIIVECMSKTLIESDKLLNENLDQDRFNAEFTSSFIASLNGCFENFAVATTAVKSCFTMLAKTLHRINVKFMEMLGNKSNLSPARRSEVFLDLHNSTRAVLSGIQLLNQGITDPSIFEPIIRQCWFELLENPAFTDSPIDTKINCAMLKVNYDRLFGDIFGPKEAILSQHDVDSSSPNALPKGIYYAIAIINTMVEKDFSDPNFYVALRAIVERLIETAKQFTIDACLILVTTRALVQFSKRLLTNMKKVTLLDGVTHIQSTVHDCLGFVWINVQHSSDCVRYLTKDLLKNIFRLGKERPDLFGNIVDETVKIAKSSSTNESLVCFLLDYLSQVFTTEYVLNEIPNIQQTILSKIFEDSCWAICYEQLMSKNSEINIDKWCDRWIKPLMHVDPKEWNHDFERLKCIRNLFERALKTKPEAAEYILTDKTISIEIYLFVLWVMRRSGRKMYAPENYRASSDPKVNYAKVHPSDEIRILALRILVECHKTSSQFPAEDLHEILEFFRYNCNTQYPAIRQQINVTMKRTMTRIECGYSTAKRTNPKGSDELCESYKTFLQNLIEFCVTWCLFDGSNFGRRSTGLNTILYTVETWQRILPEDNSIYTEKLWVQMQKSLSDTYVVNKEVASDILLLCCKYYPEKTNLIHSLDEIKKCITTFRPHDSMSAAHYIVFCAFSESYFKEYYEAVLWCEEILRDGLNMAKKSLLQTARYNALYGLILSIRQLLKRIDFSKLTDATEIENWRSFFARMIPMCKELTDTAAPVVNSSAPEGHLPNDLNDVSYYLEMPKEGAQIKVTAQMILLCAWRTVRESALLLGEIALRIPVLTTSNPNGLIHVDQLLHIGGHFQQLLVETKHRGAFEQSFLGFSNLCLRLWRSHEPQLHSYPTKLVEIIANIISGDYVEDDPNIELDLNKLCSTRRSAGIPFMVQGVVTAESQVCSATALTFCMTTFMNIAKTGPVEESRTHSLNILRSLFRCSELGDAVIEYISDGIECSIRGYSAPSWPERNSSTLLFSALMIRIFGVQRTRVSETISIKNKMTGRLFFIRYPRLYDFFYDELKSASEAIERNERPPRLHPLLLLISRLYPTAREGADSNLKLSTYIPFISTCSSSPELVTRELSAKSIVALIPSANVTERLFVILKEIQETQSLNAIHGFLLQILYLLHSSKEQNFEIDVQILKEFVNNFVELKLPVNNVIGRTYLEILLEILFVDRLQPLDSMLVNQLFEVRDKFINNFDQSIQYGQLTQSYVQKMFTIFNAMVSVLGGSGSNDSTIIATINQNTQNELIETQLNIKYLLLCHSIQKEIDTNDYNRYEIDLAKFIMKHHSENNYMEQFLPSVRELYYIIGQKGDFYPFGVIKAYDILSILISSNDAFENHTELKQLSIDELISIMTSVSDEEGVDDVAESIWVYIHANLKHCPLNVSSVTQDQMKQIMLHIRNSTKSHKSSDLRQTATEILSIIVQYFKECTDLTLLISFVELLLSLLRDDDAYLRNRTSEIVMELINRDLNTSNIQHVIPLAAEEYLLSWTDKRFANVSAVDAWSNWLELLRLVYGPLAPEPHRKELDNGNDENNLVDVDIFDDTEPNLFDETSYTSCKCYNFLAKHIAKSALATSEKETILSEFKDLRQI